LLHHAVFLKTVEGTVFAAQLVLYLIQGRPVESKTLCGPRYCFYKVALGRFMSSGFSILIDRDQALKNRRATMCCDTFRPACDVGLPADCRRIACLVSLPMPDGQQPEKPCF
jgi:hypothetical protein